MPDTEAPPVEPTADAQEVTEQARNDIRAAVEKARERLAAGGPLVPTDEGGDDATEEAGTDGEGGERGSDLDPESSEGELDQGSDDADGDGDDDAGGSDEDDESAEEVGDEDDDDGDEEGLEEGEEEDDDEETDDDSEEESEDRFVASLPGRGPDDPDIEIEVDDQATADRINHLRNGFMRGEQVRAATAELVAAREELFQIEEEFTYDPAGFVLNNVEAEQRATVALGVLVDPEVWKALAPTLTALIDNPENLRTLQAEAKAARLETKEILRDAAAAREAHNKNAEELKSAIDLIVPEEMSETKREQLIMDITRDVVDHITGHKLEKLDPKDLPTIVADRLESNGIDPLDARKALRNGSRNRGKVSTRKKSKKKPKSGKQLVKASAKRKKVAAAPGPGKKVAPTTPKPLPAGQSIQERIAEVRKRGIAAVLGNR